MSVCRPLPHGHGSATAVRDSEPRALASGSSCHHQFRRVLIRARLAVQVRFEIVAEFFNNRDGWHCGGIAQRAKSTAQHVFRQLADQWNITLLSSAGMEAIQHLLEPGSAFAARNA